MYVYMMMISIVVSVVLLGVEARGGRPVSIDQGLWCNSCQAVVQVMVERLKSKKSEMDVLEKWEGICNYENFQRFNFPPPEMKKGCEEFVAEHEDEVIDGLVSRVSNEEVEGDVCIERTKACIETSEDRDL